jgi:galactokinase/mevalonate kinase-like predicted kinase
LDIITGQVVPVEFLEDNDVLMDMAPASTDLEDASGRAVRFDLDLSAINAPDMENGMIVLSALGQFHEFCHSAGMDEQMAVIRTFELYDILSAEEKDALDEVLASDKIDGNNSFRLALKTQRDYKLAKEIEGMDLEATLEAPSSILHELGVKIADANSIKEIDLIIKSGLFSSSKKLQEKIELLAKSRDFNKDKESFISAIERSLRWKEQWALWLIGQKLIDIPYDQQAVADILKEQALSVESADIDANRNALQNVVRSTFNNDIEAKNIERVNAKLSEEGILLICGRVSRAFGNQMMLLSNSKSVRDSRPLEKITKSLEKETSGIREFDTGIERFKNLAFGVGKNKRIFVTQLKGALWHMRRDIIEWQKLKLANIDSLQEKDGRKMFGRKPEGYFEKERQNVFNKFAGISKLLDEYGQIISTVDAKNASYLILQQRFFPGETHRIAQLNHGQDAFPGKIDILRNLFRTGSSFRYATPGIVPVIKDGKRGTASWIQKTNHWVEAIPMFIKERRVIDAVMEKGKLVEKEEVQTEVDQAGMEAFFRGSAEEWAKNCEEVEDAEHVALARELLVEHLLKTKQIDVVYFKKLSGNLGKEEAYRQVVIEKSLGDKVAELAVKIENQYLSNIEKVFLYKAERNIPRIDAVRNVVIKEGLVNIDTELDAALKDKITFLAGEVYKKRRSVSTLHVLTTESAGMTQGFVRTWLEEEMTLYNAVKANGWEGEVEDRMKSYSRRLEVINRKIINEFGMWSEVEEAKIVNDIKDDSAAIRIVIGSNRILAEEVAKAATLIEFYERESGNVDLENTADPKALADYIKRHGKDLEQTAAGKVVEFNGRAIEQKIEDLIATNRNLSREKAIVKAIEEDKDFQKDFQNFILIEARKTLLEELNKQYKHLGLADKAENYMRNHTALAKSWARREVIAIHGAQALTEDLKYKYTATGVGKRYNLVYGPSRVDLGTEEFDSVVRWPQWVGAIDDESADSAREFYNQINEAGVVVRPWIEWQEIQKTAENANMTAGKAFANTLALMVKAIGIGDAQWLMDQMSLRQDKDRGTPSPSEGYAGYCVPKDGLFQAFVLSLTNKRKLEQMNIPAYLHPVIMKLARELLYSRDKFESEFEWEIWAAKKLLEQDNLKKYMKEYVDIRQETRPGMKAEEMLVFNLTKLAKVIGNFGKPWEHTATGARIFDTAAARMAQKIMIEGTEQIQRYMVSYKTSLIRRALRAVGREKDAKVVFTAEYKKLQDIRFSAGARKLEMLAQIGEALPYQFTSEGQALYFLDEMGFTSVPKLKAERDEASKLSGDEKKRKELELDKREMASQFLYDMFRLVDGMDDDVINRFEKEFPRAEIPKDIRLVSSTMASTLDIMHYYDDTQLEQIADVVQAKLSEYGLTEDQMRANTIVYGGDLAQWAVIKELPNARKKELLNSKIYIKVKGDNYEYPIEGAIHALVLKLRGPYRSYLDAIQGADVVDFGIDFKELLDIAYNYPKFIKLMLTGNPESALIVSDTGVGRINRSFTYEDVRMYFAACDAIAGEGRGNYIALDVGEEVVKYLRSEMNIKKDRSKLLLEALKEVSNAQDGTALSEAVSKAQDIYNSISGQIINSHEAEEQLDEEERVKRYNRWRERDNLITKGLSRINQGLELGQLDFGTWLTIGGRYLVVGQSEEEIKNNREIFDKAMSIINQQGKADKDGLSRVDNNEEDKIVAALALPEFIPEAQKFQQVFGKEGSSKAVETGSDRAFQKRSAYRLKEIRLKAFNKREEGFKSASAVLTKSGFGFDQCLDTARLQLDSISSDMQILFSSDDLERKTQSRDNINNTIGGFLAYAREGLLSIVKEIMPEGTAEEKKAKEDFIRNIERLYSGREINIDAWKKINGGYRDPKGDFGRLAEAAKGDKAQLKRIADAGIELFYTTLAVGQTAEFLQLEKKDLNQKSLWFALADFFAETMYDHKCNYMPWLFIKGEGYGIFSEEELYGMAVEKHARLDKYFSAIYSNVTDISEWTDDERDVFFGNFENGKNITAIGNNAPTENMRKWRSYNAKRDIAFNMSDGFNLPVVFTEFDPEIIDAENRTNVLFLFPAGRTHISRSWREGPTLNVLREAEGKRGVNLIVNRYDEFKDVGGKKSVLMNTSGYICISKEEFVEALIRHKGYKPNNAKKFADNIERDDFIKSMIANTKCSYSEAEKKAIELQKKGIRLSKGITIAARFTKPVRSDNIIPYHGAELYDSGELQRNGIPSTVQNLALSDVTYDKSIYGAIFDESGVRLPEEINWRLEYEGDKAESEILDLIINGVEGTPFIGLKKFAENHQNIVSKGAEESGARGLDTFTLLNAADLRRAAKFTYDVAHARSEGQNVAIQEALLMSPEVWAAEGLLQAFVDRQIMEWSRPVERGKYPRSRIYGTARAIISSSSPDKEYDLTHPIVLMGLQVATNVGRGGTLECLLSDFIQPEYQEMVLKELKVKGSLVNKALGNYLRLKYEPKQKKGESDSVFALRRDTQSKDLIGRPYWWVPYEMNDFAFNIQWEKSGELVDVEPIYDSQGNRIGGKPILRGADGKRFEGKITNIELVLLEPNVGIGLWPNYSKREEALQWKNVIATGKEFNIDAIGVSDRKVIENIGVLPGEEYKEANFGKGSSVPMTPRSGTARPIALDDDNQQGPPAILEKAAKIARHVLGLHENQKFTVDQMSVLIKYLLIVEADNIRTVTNISNPIEDIIRNIAPISFDDLKKSGLIKGLNLDDFNADENYFTRIKELAIGEVTGGYRVAPELQIVPGKISAKDAKKILKDRENFAVVFSDNKNFTNELYPLIQDSYTQGFNAHAEQTRNVIGVNRLYLTEDGKAARIIIYNHDTGELKEMELEEPIKIDRALTLYASQEAHKEISVVFNKNSIEEVNPYEESSLLDTKSNCSNILSKQGINVPGFILASMRENKDTILRELKLYLLRENKDTILRELKLCLLRENKDTILRELKLCLQKLSEEKDGYVSIVIKPNTGTEGELAKGFIVDIQNPDSDVLWTHIEAIIKAGDDAIITKFRGNIRYSEDGGKTTYACTFRFNVTGDGENYEANSGYLQVAGSPDSLIASVSQGGKIVGFSEALDNLYVDSGDGKSTKVAKSYAASVLIPAMQEEAEKAVNVLDAKFAGIDINPESNAGEAEDSKKPVCYILDANPRPAGLTHSEAIDVEREGNIFTFWEKSDIKDEKKQDMLKLWFEKIDKKIESIKSSVRNESKESLIEFMEDILFDEELSNNFSTHHVTAYLVERLGGLDAENRDKFVQKIFPVILTAPQSIIEDDLNVPIQSIIDLIGDTGPIKRTLLAKMINNMEEYTAGLKSDDKWIFDKSARAMRFISACIDELKKTEGSTTLKDMGNFLRSVLDRFGKDDPILMGLLADIARAKGENPDLELLAKNYDKIVPRLINLKAMRGYVDKYGKPKSKPMARKDFDQTVRVEFPVGISNTRCAIDNLGRVLRQPAALVKYFLGAIKFRMEQHEVPAGYVTVKRLREKKLVLHSKSYNTNIEIDLNSVMGSKEFFDKKTETRLLKEALVANGIVSEDSRNIAKDILRFTRGGGLEIVTDTIVPGGTGLGTSGALATALCTALNWFTNHRTEVDDELLNRSIYLEHRLGLGSGTQDCRRPVKGPSPFKICTQKSGKPFPWSVKFEFLENVKPEEVEKHLVLFFPGFSRESKARLGAVLSGHLARDPEAYQAMLDVAKLQDEMDEEFKHQDFETYGNLSGQYQKYRDIMDPTDPVKDAHILRAIKAIQDAPGIWGCNFTGSPGGVVMIWCPADKKRDVINYLEGLKDNTSLIHNEKPIFQKARVLDYMFTNEGYKVKVTKTSVKKLQPIKNIKVFIDDVMFTLVERERMPDDSIIFKSEPGLVEFYNDKLKNGCVQLLVTGDAIEDVWQAWISKLNSAARKNVVLLSLSGMMWYRFDEDGKPYVIFSVIEDYLSEDQRANIDGFYKEWSNIQMEAAKIFLGDFKGDPVEFGDDNLRYFSEKGFFDTRKKCQNAFNVNEETRVINEDETSEINRKLKEFGIKDMPEVKSGDNRLEFIEAYYDLAYKQRKLDQYGFKPAIARGGYFLDMKISDFDKGKALKLLIEKEVIKDALGRDVDLKTEAEIHGDQLSKGRNDSSMALALPDTMALSVGAEKNEDCPPNVIVYGSAAEDALTGPKALLKNFQQRELMEKQSALGRFIKTIKTFL